VIERTFDADLIKSIVKRPDIWATIAPDGKEPDGWEPNLKECWLKVMHNEQIAGLFNYHVVEPDTLEVHPMILHEYRGTVALDAAKQSLRWIVENSPYQAIKCLVPDLFRNVRLFAMQCGFVKTNKKYQIYPKNGKIYDMWELVITRSDIEAKHYE